MKRIIFLIILAVFCCTSLFAVKEIVLVAKDVVNLEEVFDENEIIFKQIKGLEFDKNGNLYYLAKDRAIIFKINSKTFELVKTISSKGQGPAELLHPLSLRVKGDNIFVWDLGFYGIKIFDLDGKIIKEYKFPSFTFSLSMGLNKMVDVDSKRNIFIRHVDDKNNSLMSVFDFGGKLIRQLIPLDFKRDQDTKQWFFQVNFNFQLDMHDNIIMLQNKKGILSKLDSKGKLIWECDLYSDLPKELKMREKFKVNDSKGFSIGYTQDFITFCLLDEGKIFVSSVKLGMVYDGAGKLVCLVRKPDGKGFGSPVNWYNGKLYSPYHIYDFKKIWR